MIFQPLKDVVREQRVVHALGVEHSESVSEVFEHGLLISTRN